ncbi:unnamed protein product [Dicrocoelium dendriticum]|nr:unnamed protein product [Dicrocoelium dendriticum]
MIEVDTRKRITLKEVLGHKWVTGDQDMPLQLELPMTQAVQTAIIPARSDIDPDIFGTMTSLQCFRDQEKLVEELLSPAHNTEKVIYFLLLDRKLRNPSSDDPEEIRSRSSTLSLSASKADPPRKRIDSLKLTLNGSSRLSLGNLSEGSPLSGRRGLAVQKLRKQSCSSGLDSQSSTPAVSPLGSPLSLQRVHCRTVSCESTGTVVTSPNSLAIPSPYRSPVQSPNPSSAVTQPAVNCTTTGNKTPTGIMGSAKSMQHQISTDQQHNKTHHTIPDNSIGVPMVGGPVGPPHPNMNIYCFGNIPPLTPGVTHLMHHPPLGPMAVPTTLAHPFVPALHLIPHSYPHPFPAGPYLIPAIPPFNGPTPPTFPPITTETYTVLSCNPNTGHVHPAVSAPQPNASGGPVPQVKQPPAAQHTGTSAQPMTTSTAVTNPTLMVSRMESPTVSQPNAPESEAISGQKTSDAVSQHLTSTSTRQNISVALTHELRTTSPNTAPSSPVDSLPARSKRSSIPYSPPVYISRHQTLAVAKHSHIPSLSVTDKGRLNGSTVCSPAPCGRTLRSPLTGPSSPTDRLKVTQAESVNQKEPRSDVTSLVPQFVQNLQASRMKAGNAGTSTMTAPTSPTSSGQPWRVKLNNLKMSFLGSPRFHRKKTGLVEETPPSSPKSSGFSCTRPVTTGRSATTEPSPLLTHKSWFDGFLTATSGHVILKGSQNAYNAEAAAHDAAALALSTNARLEETKTASSGACASQPDPIEPPAPNEGNTPSTVLADETGTNGEVSTDEDSKTKRQVAPCKSSLPEPATIPSSPVFDSIGPSNVTSERRISSKPAVGTGNPNSLSEETNHVVMIKGRALNRLKAELVQVFLATPGVVHTVISPTSFRAEYRRAGSGSSLLARPVKLQVDMVRATGGISTGAQAAGSTGAQVPSEREVYAINFQLLSGPTRRFKRLCDQLQTALLAGTLPVFPAPGSMGNGNTANRTHQAPTSPQSTTPSSHDSESHRAGAGVHSQTKIVGSRINARHDCVETSSSSSSGSGTTGSTHQPPPFSPTRQFRRGISSPVPELNGVTQKTLENTTECTG